MPCQTVRHSNDLFRRICGFRATTASDEDKQNGIDNCNQTSTKKMAENTILKVGVAHGSEFYCDEPFPR